MLTTKVVSNKKPPLLSDSESGGSTSLVLILLGVYFYQSRRQGICWYIPLGEFLFFIVTSILGQFVFDRGLVQFGNYNQLLEESCEIIAYIALICYTYDISFKRRYIHIRYFSIR